MSKFGSYDKVLSICNQLIEMGLSEDEMIMTLEGRLGCESDQGSEVIDDLQKSLEDVKELLVEFPEDVELLKCYAVLLDKLGYLDDARAYMIQAEDKILELLNDICPDELFLSTMDNGTDKSALLRMLRSRRKKAKND